MAKGCQSNIGIPDAMARRQPASLMVDKGAVTLLRVHD